MRVITAFDHVDRQIESKLRSALPSSVNLISGSTVPRAKLTDNDVILVENSSASQVKFICKELTGRKVGFIRSGNPLSPYELLRLGCEDYLYFDDGVHDLKSTLSFLLSQK